jgi:DNA-nicking Smr family endonuclease
MDLSTRQDSAPRRSGAYRGGTATREHETTFRTHHGEILAESRPQRRRHGSVCSGPIRRPTAPVILRGYEKGARARGSRPPGSFRLDFLPHRGNLSRRGQSSKYNCPVTKRGDDASDAEALANAMADVIPLAPDPRGRSHPKAPSRAPPPAATSSTEGDLDGQDEDFAVPGVDRREIRKLKRGEYSAQGRLDLHGMTAADARVSAGRFIDHSRHSRHRCVCIVYGRGLHSEGKVSVLKAHVRAYLRSHRSVLAFADAPQSDGGAGAVYILLRK